MFVWYFVVWRVFLLFSVLKMFMEWSFYCLVPLWLQMNLSDISVLWKILIFTEKHHSIIFRTKLTLNWQQSMMFFFFFINKKWVCLYIRLCAHLWEYLKVEPWVKGKIQTTLLNTNDIIALQKWLHSFIISSVMTDFFSVPGFLIYNLLVNSS